MPTTIEQHEASLRQPAFSELLPVRDILNDVIAFERERTPER